MEHLSHVRAAIRSRLGQAPVRGILAGGILLLLALAVSGLLLSPLAASAPAPLSKAEQAAVISPFRTRPRRTPTPTPTPQPTLTPTPTAAPSPTALPTGTAAVTGTVVSSARTGEASGSGKGGAQAAEPSPGTLLGWGLGALAGIVFGVFILLFTRRTARAEQQLPFAPPTQKPTRARLNQLYQLLPARQAALPMAAEEITEPLMEEDQGWQPLQPLHGTQSLPPLKPPRWLIEAGLLKADTGEWSAAGQQEPSGERNASTDEPNEGTQRADKS